MVYEILMPALSPTMTEGTLARWLVKEGDEVRSGDVVAEIETDKATMEVESIEEGVVGKIMVGAGTHNVAVNSVIAVLLEDGEDAENIQVKDKTDIKADEALKTGESSPVSGKSLQSESLSVGVAFGRGENKAVENKAGEHKAVENKAGASNGVAIGERIRISPLARKMSQIHDLDISKIIGSGPRGRIVKRDIERVLSDGISSTAQVETSAPSEVGFVSGGVLSTRVDMLFPNSRVEPHSSMRKIIAQRLTESKQTIPHFYLNMDVVIDDLLSFRKQVNDVSDGGYKISVNDIIIKGVAHALIRESKANAAWSDDGILYFDSADVAVAVATDGGLITPIVRDAQTRGLVEISVLIKDYAKRAREGKLLPEEYQGGTFTVSNLGMFGIDNFAAVINPPQACILGIGRGREVAVFEGNNIVKKNLMTITLSVDHRVVDGAVGAKFLQTLKGYLESPATMIL